MTYPGYMIYNYINIKYKTKIKKLYISPKFNLKFIKNKFKKKKFK